ncbi:MAG: putative addiction module antidote protein [Treponema sp.]|jgi:probable addiction module antidote protein|nr:putative addiction module antidote protein [Treponema sp.]
MNLQLKKWDVTEHMDNEEYISEYLRSAFESGDISEITRALGDVARARNMTDLAEKMGISRQGLYKTLSENGNPEFATIQKLITALGLQMSIITSAKPVRNRASSLSPS